MNSRAEALIADNQNAEELAQILCSLASNLDDEFQVDFIKPELTVVRKRKAPRVWQKVAEGKWGQEDVATLIARGLIVLHSKSMQGWEIHPRPELIGAV